VATLLLLLLLLCARVPLRGEVSNWEMGSAGARPQLGAAAASRLFGQGVAQGWYGQALSGRVSIDV
jgi:hypothetical protein